MTGREGERRRLLMAARLLGAALAALAAACCVLVALTQGDASHPPRHAYWPFTVEVVVWDVGANPWDGADAPSLTPTLLDDPRL